tara:strand:- start:1292 stop:1744 length:453 start_codon:yes stop_codon:yes gene_type:complete
MDIKPGNPYFDPNNDPQTENNAGRSSKSTASMRNPYSFRDYMNKLKQMEYQKGGKAEGPKYPHDMYNPKTGEKFIARNEADHEEMKKKGYKHLDEMNDSEKKKVMEFKAKMKEMEAGGRFEQKMEAGGRYEQKMAMGGKYDQFKRLMGLD